VPAITRKAVQTLPHRKRSGLFQTRQGEFVADINPDDGKRILRRLGTDRERAIVVFQGILAAMAQQTQDREDPTLLAFLLDTFLPSQRHLKSYAYTRERVSALVAFLEVRYSTVRVSEVRRLHADALIDFYVDRSPRTKQADIQKLKQALNLAVDLDLLDANPLARYKGPRFDNRRLRTCSMDDFCRLLSLAEETPRLGDLADVVKVLAMTGLRVNNVLRLAADEVDGKTIRIRPEKTKNGRWCVIPISSVVSDILRGRNAVPHYFASPRHVKAPRKDIQWGWRTLRQAASPDWMHCHDLRHFFASQLAKQGANEQQIGRLLCHMGQSVTSRYVHQDIEDLRPFVEELSERYLQAAGEPSLPYRDEDRVTV